MRKAVFLSQLAGKLKGKKLDSIGDFTLPAKCRLPVEQ
jgi:hypothetical protein